MDTATRIERAVALGLAIAGLLALLPLTQLVLAIEYGEPGHTPNPRTLFNFAAAGTSFALALVLSAWIAWRGPQERTASTLALALALGGATWVLNVLFMLLWVVNDYISHAPYLIPIALAVGVYLSCWALARFLAHFPEPISVTRLEAAGVAPPDAGRAERIIRRTTGAPAALAGSVVMVFAAVHPLLAQWAGTGRVEAVMLLLLIVPLVPLGVGLLAVERQRRSADADGRRRLRWIWTGMVGGFALFAALSVSAALITGLGDLFRWMVSAFFVAASFCCVCFAVAVLARGDLSPDLVLRRTLVYSAAGLLVTIGFVALLNLLQEHVLGWLGVPPGAAVYLAGGALAVAFGPLQRRLDAWLATRLPGA